MSKLLLAALLALSFAGPSRAEPAPEGRALLRKVSDTYRALASYQFEGEVTVKVNGGGMDTTMRLPMVVAADRTGRSRVSLRHPRMGGTIVSDGTRTTTYVDLYNQYVQRPAEPALDSTGGLKPPPNSPVTRYFDPLQGLRAAAVTGERTLVIGGAPSECWTLSCDLAPPPAFAADSTARSGFVLWVDKARGLVLRDSTTMRLHNPTDGSSMASDQVTSYTLVRVNQALPDSLFAFVPPSGAKRVEAFGTQAGDETPSPLVGKPAPPFTLKGVKGSTVSLSSYKGRVVLLDFWATWCRPCRIEMPHIEALYREFKAKGLVVFGVNFAEDPATVKAFLAQNPYTIPILLDSHGDVGRTYEADAIPTLVVIGRDGKVSSYFTGVREEEALRAALAKAGIK